MHTTEKLCVRSGNSVTYRRAHPAKEKCVIIALDALEYDLVEEFSLENLKQKECGKTDLQGFGLLATPIIWASFITGLAPEKHKVNFYWVWDNDVLEKPIVSFLSHKIGGILELLGFKRTHHRKKHFMRKGIKTIFDLVDNSVALNVPSYQEYASREISRALHDAITNSSREVEFETKVWKVFKRRRKECLHRFEEGGWKVFMAYFNFTDYFGHLFRGNLAKMSKVYSVAEKLVRDLKSKINSDQTLFLVISDHGMKPVGRYGDHSNYGFYSVNEQLGLQNPKITDFFQIILDELNVIPTQVDEMKNKEKVIKSLKSLGYF